MKKMALSIALAGLLAGCGDYEIRTTDKAGMRQAKATRTAMDAADREIGMPRIANFSQKKLLKNAYEDMDQTTLTYVYAQSLDGRFLCLGQAVGYGVSLGTQFTSPEYPQGLRFGHEDPTMDGTYMIAQPEPNGLFMPESGAATIVNLIDPTTGIARTSLIEPNVITTPNKLPSGVVSVACPSDIDPASVKDAKETSAVKQRD